MKQGAQFSRHDIDNWKSFLVLHVREFYGILYGEHNHVQVQTADH